jgi:uncharacterized protein HemX
VTKYLTIGLLVALCLALGAVIVMQRQNASLSAENASLTRSLATLEQSRDQARLAADVARAAAAREKSKADEYDALRNALINGEQDEELPAWFADYVAAVLGRVPD